jgi:putative peptide zinc metalloprotease protein
MLAQLHDADLLLCNVPRDAVELFRRYEKQQRTKLKQRWLSPLPRFCVAANGLVQ